MDETLKKQLKDTILKTISNGIAFDFITVEERDEKERDLVKYLNSKGYQAVVEKCMIYVLSEDWERIVMMELTRNTLYFTPADLKKTSEVVYYALQFTAKGYLDKLTLKYGATEVYTKKEEKKEFDDEEDTEEDRPPPNFDFL